MHGNRDFLIGSGFARETGIALLDDPHKVDLNGTPALLMHGDTLCTDDREYQAFRAQVRGPAWRSATLAKPLAERLAFGRQLRGGSEAAKLGKTEVIMDVAPAAVERAFLDSGLDLLIHGHTHRPARHVVNVAGRERVRWVLADWYARGSYLEATPAGLHAMAFG
jgi:UDP-2,3-diacylglucosamine hydrolase